MINRKLKMIAACFLLLAMGIGLGLVSMYFGAAYFAKPMFLSYFDIRLLPLLNILPVVIVIFMVYLVVNRVWISFLLTALITLGLTWANYWKLLIRNDPLLARDLTLFNESLMMAGEYSLQLDGKIVTVLAICLAGTVFSYFFVKVRVASYKIRVLGIALLSLASVVLFNRVYLDSELYFMKENDKLINRWSQTHHFISKGFIYPFLYSFNDFGDQPPEGYDKKTAQSAMEGTPYSDIPEAGRVNVIAVMLEAYNDFSKFESIVFEKEVYEPWHKLKSESYSGELVTNIFSGGTVNTEWGFLTGYTDLKDFRKNVNSYVRYFAEQGYTVEGSHPSYDWFYNRKNVNRYLGFERYYFYDNYYSELTGGEIAADSILFPEIIALYEANKAQNKPYFSFNVTYQNHGPYAPVDVGNDAFIKQEGLASEHYHILNNYLAGINQTNIELGKMIDYFRNEDEPVVVILFGDHNPWLGDYNSVYQALNINLDLGTDDGFYNYFNTPYIIWANDQAKDVLGHDFIGNGPTIGPYFLMNEFFRLAGYEGNEFMKRSNELKETIEVVHAGGLYKEYGVLTSELTRESREKLKEFQQLEYYWKHAY